MKLTPEIKRLTWLADHWIGLANFTIASVPPGDGAFMPSTCEAEALERGAQRLARAAVRMMSCFSPTRSDGTPGRPLPAKIEGVRSKRPTTIKGRSQGQKVIDRVKDGWFLCGPIDEDGALYELCKPPTDQVVSVPGWVVHALIRSGRFRRRYENSGYGPIDMIGGAR